jgi:hypothetical protein
MFLGIAGCPCLVLGAPIPFYELSVEPFDIFVGHAASTACNEFLESCKRIWVCRTQCTADAAEAGISADDLVVQFKRMSPPESADIPPQNA